ncbi:MAG: type II toxin-antitoxin system HicA family toxin [Deltaproteobacteria bacterium]|nr:type II toxin-antitoxin system HicA family toxin [Deltaproteobacteria bacterium]
MSPKIKDLIKILEKAGFVNRGGKSSHPNFSHPKGFKLTLSGKPSQDFA